jgi:hypothetical protein
MTLVAAPARPDASPPAGPGAGPGAAVPLDALLAVRRLSVVPEGDEFLVGDPARAEYVLLPAVGVEVLRLLRAGRSVGEAAAAIGPDVDVPDFAATLLELGFARRAPAAGAAGAAAGAMAPGPARPAAARAWRVPPGLLRLVRRLTLPQQRELDEAHPPDLAVARWYAVVSVSGVALAVGFFFVYYLPATLHLIGWLAATVGAARITTLEFWTALLFAGVVLSPRALTVAVFVRDLRRAHQARATSPGG